MAITKQKKEELVALYQEWIEKSQVLIITEYTGLSMTDFNELRKGIREIGGEFHVLKNTLCKVAFQSAGLEFDDQLFVGSTAVGFSFQDPPLLAKAMAEFSKSNDLLKVKGGYLDRGSLSVSEIKSLAELPPLPALRVQILSTILAPASKLIRTIAEPARQITAVLKSYSEKGSTALA